MNRTILTLTFSLNTHGAMAASGQREIQIDIVPATFSRKPEALVRLLSEYYPVQFYSASTDSTDKVRRRSKQSK
jgi:hypothetical protein